ncbi:hypothetical protein AKO1_012875 [Acrasis kona]|uniref:Glycosyl transferase 48 domain-containing protein n=1 Tax=Acrasis kona TaxID=1008807 RepID=A0AAW2YUJ2_9EUKA
MNYLWNPTVPKFCSVENMRATRITVPVYNETIIENFKKITDWENTNTSFLEHCINKHRDEWINFKNKPKHTDKDRKRLHRLEEAVFAKKKDIHLSVLDKKEDEELRLGVRLWASNRFQFVCRTIKGASKVFEGMKFLHKLQSGSDDRKADQIARRKVKLYMGAQVYSKREDNQQYCEDIDTMLKMYGNKGMHVAYQRIRNNKCEAVLRTSGNTSDDVTCRSMGDFIMGQGKPCHQAFLLQFFDGTVNECVDCNQDMNLSQSFFLPAVVDNFGKDVRTKIVGFKEYITTMHWSAAGYGAGYTEKVFGSIVQKSWAMLGVRYHYGHPDFVRATGIMFETGCSKLDVVSEDIFLGIDTQLGGGLIQYIDYYEVGKARDVCIDTTSAFMSKIAGGARHVSNSRQVAELMTPLFYNPFRQLSIYQTTIGHYLSALLVLISYVSLSVIRIVLSILSFALQNREQFPSFKRVYDQADSYFWMQMGIALSVPGLFQALVDTGITGLVTYFVYLKFFVQTVFSAFHLLNTAYYFNKSFNNVPTYLASGRTPGLTHKDIRTVFNNYYKTHFRVCLFLIITLIIIFAMRLSWQALLVNGVFIILWMFSPFLFNRGSFSITVGEHTWRILTQEDWHFVHSFGVRAIFKKNKQEVDPKLLKKPSILLRPFLAIRRKFKHLITFLRACYCWLLNYVYIGACLTGVQYVNILIWLVPILFPFWAHKPRDEFYEERKKDLLQSTVTELEAWSVQITDEEARIKGEIRNMEGQVNTLKSMQNDLRSQLTQNSAAIKHIQENGVFGGNGEGGVPLDGEMSFGDGPGGPPPPPPPPPPMMDMNEFAKQQKEKREKALDIPPEIIPIIKAQVGDSNLNQATDEDLQGMMGSELADMVIKSLNMDFKETLKTITDSYAKYDTLWANKDKEDKEDFPPVDEMMKDLRQFLRELPKGVDLQKLREITKMQNLKDWSEADVAVVNKVVGFWAQVEECASFESVIDKVKTGLLKGESAILQWGDANKASNRLSNGRARSLRTNIEDIQASIPNQYQGMLDKYREVTQGNIPVLQGLRSNFGKSFDEWNAKWRQVIGVYQFRFAMLSLRCDCILHQIFDEWYFDAVASRQKKLTVLQLRNSRTKCEKVIGAFTQTQAFFKKSKELFAMHLNKLDIEIKDFVGYENVDEEVVKYIKGLFSSDKFVDTRDAWLHHNETLGAQFKHLGTFEEEDDNAVCSVERDEDERDEENELLYTIDEWHQIDQEVVQALKDEETEALRLLKEKRGDPEEAAKKAAAEKAAEKKKNRKAKKEADEKINAGAAKQGGVFNSQSESLNEIDLPEEEPQDEEDQ